MQESRYRSSKNVLLSHLVVAGLGFSWVYIQTGGDGLGVVRGSLWPIAIGFAIGSIVGMLDYRRSIREPQGPSNTERVKIIALVLVLSVMLFFLFLTLNIEPVLPAVVFGLSCSLILFVIIVLAMKI